MKSSQQQNFQEDINKNIDIWKINTTDLGESDSYFNLNLFDDENTNDADCIPVGEVPRYKTGVLLYDGAVYLQGKVLLSQCNPSNNFEAFGVIKALSSGLLIPAMMFLCYLSFCVKRSGTWKVSSQYTSWGIR